MKRFTRICFRAFDRIDEDFWLVSPYLVGFIAVYFLIMVVLTIIRASH